MEDNPDLQALQARVEQEERAYSALLATLDRLASDLPLPAERLPDLPALAERLNASWETAPPPAADGLRGRHQRAVWAAVA
ncbi:MAG: hypothetical protein ABW221_15895, partial [Vicinamibacteria bacterium]